MEFNSYWTNDESPKIAFTMPYSGEDSIGYKIVVQNSKHRHLISTLVRRRFKDREAAQEVLNSIAYRKGWKKRL